MDSLFDFKDIKKLIRLANSLDDKGLYKEADDIDQSISAIGYGKGGRGITKFSDGPPTAATPTAGTPTAATPTAGTPTAGTPTAAQVQLPKESTSDWSVTKNHMADFAKTVLTYLEGKGQKFDRYDFWAESGQIWSQSAWAINFAKVQVPWLDPSIRMPNVSKGESPLNPEQTGLQLKWAEEIKYIVEKSKETDGEDPGGPATQSIGFITGIINQLKAKMMEQSPAAAPAPAPAPAATGRGGRGSGRGTGSGSKGGSGTKEKTTEQIPTSTGIITKTLSDGSILYYKMGPRRRYIGVIDYDPDGSKRLGPQKSTRYVFYNTETKAIQESTFRFPMTNDEKAQVDQVKKNVVDRKRAERAASRATTRQTNIQQAQTARTQAQSARQAGRTERQEQAQTARTQAQTARQEGRATRQEQAQTARTQAQTARQEDRAAKQEQAQTARTQAQTARQEDRAARQEARNQKKNKK